ncbi:hypothetical protein BdWA1_001471 [Babesia duncani]|uniref:Large ribosomal subunit protein mL54 n=1 Tax=Babesia duncani TaxID=323732 RepID=A0AAD9PPF8_9APIC|nr:hypothetical protein BdWA1_001471 [Babesia duncani]
MITYLIIITPHENACNSFQFILIVVNQHFYGISHCDMYGCSLFFKGRHVCMQNVGAWGLSGVCYIRTSVGHFAPKVKSQKDATAPARPTSTVESEHLFNIYAAIPQDHEMLPDEAYPKWLWELDKPEKTYGELALMFIYGMNIEDAQYRDYRRFRRLHNRLLIKQNNARLCKYRVKY